MNCYSCNQAAVLACRRCAKPYCEDHGNQQYCAECLHPASAMPSFNLYRGALLTMLIATALAVFLLVRPPGETGGASPVVVGRSTPTATPGSGTVVATVTTPEGTATAATTPTPAPTAEPTDSPFLEYVVQDGDTLFDIAAANLPAGDDLAAYVEAIASLNEIEVDTVLTVGDTILLPPPPAPDEQ